MLIILKIKQYMSINKFKCTLYIYIYIQCKINNFKIIIECITKNIINSNLNIYIYNISNELLLITILKFKIIYKYTINNTIL